MADDKSLEKRVDELEDLANSRFYITVLGLVVSIAISCFIGMNSQRVDAGLTKRIDSRLDVLESKAGVVPATPAPAATATTPKAD